MSANCPVSGECAFAGICEAGDNSLVLDAISSSPEMQVLGPEITKDEIQRLAAPVVEAWASETCLRERVRALKGLQFRTDISHVSITMGSSVLDKVSEVLGVS